MTPHGRHARSIATAASVFVAALTYNFVAARSTLTFESRGDRPSFSTVSRSNRAYPQVVSWVTVCHVSRSAPDDPIIFPGQPGASHAHTFSGNMGITAFSTPRQLSGESTNCTNSKDRAAYWMPTLLVDGQVRMPYVTRLYYRAATRDVAEVKPMPFGLEMVAGDPMAMAPQRTGIAGFHCRIEEKGAVVAKSSIPPRCPTNSIFEASVTFPNCWDGRRLTSPDHRSHVSYAVHHHCDDAHPVQIPQLTMSERFLPGTTAGRITLAAMNSPLTLHADFMDAWDTGEMNRLVELCIHAERSCEGVSDGRKPPPTR